MIFANRLFAGTMLLIAGGFFIAAGSLPHDAANWPRVFSVILVLFSCGLIFDSFKAPEREAGSKSPLLVLKGKARTLMVIVGASMFYLALLEHVGFVLLTPGFLGILVWILGYKDLRKAGIIALSTTFVVWFSFELLLQVPLPEGIFNDFFTTLRGSIF